jgi:hypothetical protein
VQWPPPTDDGQSVHWGTGFAHMTAMPGLLTVRDLLILMRVLNRLEALHAASRRHTHTRLPHPAPGSHCSRLLEALYGPAHGVRMPTTLTHMFQQWSPCDPRGELFSTVMAMYHALPTSWVSATASTLPSVLQPQGYLAPTSSLLPPSHAAVTILLQHMGWGSGHTHVPLLPGGEVTAGLTVRKATLLQLGGVLHEQRDRRREYVLCALGGVRETAEDWLRALEAQLHALWRLPCDNLRKDTLWRLTVNGVPMAGGHDVCPREPCLCGWQYPEGLPDAHARALALRQHCFWECPVARAVSAEVASALPTAAPPLRQEHLWLLSRPQECPVHNGVWGLVCMLALDAMLHGRKAMWALRAEAASVADPAQTLITDFFPSASGGPAAPELPLVDRAARRAAIRFWCLLQDFASLADAPWAADLPDTHPFLSLVSGRLRLNPPPGAILPTTLDTVDGI